MVFATHQRSDQAESVLLAGLVREQVVARAREQVVRGVDVEIEFIPQPRENVIRIDATVLVESESRKGILIGAAGRIIKSIGVTARYPNELEPASRVANSSATCSGWCTGSKVTAGASRSVVVAPASWASMASGEALTPSRLK